MTPTSSMDWLGLVRRYAVPFLLVVVAGRQMYLSSFDELSRWKGGGFGMYSEIYPSFYNVSLQFNAAPQPFTPDDYLNGLKYKVQLHPSNSNLNALKEAIQLASGVDDVTIKVWKPRFNDETLKFTRDLYIEY